MGPSICSDMSTSPWQLCQLENHDIIKTCVVVVCVYDVTRGSCDLSHRFDRLLGISFLAGYYGFE